uniref:uncharacterized protein LOC105352762 n=1 Tax=Fragaria vesca subsp. vesca TaxID=101020 RepID=UPI0005C9E888|nr:PREDICTED: uncharacterized protein LOC105352762 [Fragaria vesca subsp. vesca]
MLMKSAEIPQTISTFRNLRNLKQLSLILQPGLFQLGSVVNILKATPLLEELEIMVFSTSIHLGIDMNSGFPHSHLRSVQIRNCHGTLYEIEFAILILKMATKLEKMVIDPLGKFYKCDGSWVVEEPYCCYDKSYELRNVDVDGVPHLWKRRVRAHIREKLEVVMTDAQVIIL